MAELPTPHSIAIGTLISLYSDGNSPLLSLDWSAIHRHQNRTTNGIVQQPPKSTTEWSLRLMTLIQQLVLKDDEGRVILPSLINSSSNSTRGGMNDENSPANNNINSSNNNAHGFFTNNDPSLKKNLNNDDIILDDDEYFMKKHKLLLDGTSLDVADIFNDVTSLFTHPGGGGSGYNNNNVERNLFESNSSSNSGHGTSINFSMESLSTLLDRIDETFLSNNNTSTTAHNQS